MATHVGVVSEYVITGVEIIHSGVCMCKTSVLLHLHEIYEVNLTSFCTQKFAIKVHTLAP